LYSLLRYLLGHEKTPWEKLLLMARFMDCLERDFKAIYPDMVSPLPDGYEVTLRKMFDNQFKGKK